MNYLNIELNGIDKNGVKSKYKLSDFIGENLILYFYPQDDTPVCTEEAKKFNEEIENLKKYAKVIGVSNNNIEDHKIFQEKYKLNFILLSDIENKLKNSILEYLDKVNNIKRSTFIIDKKGEIVKYWEKVDVDEHIKEIFDFFKS